MPWRLLFLQLVLFKVVLLIFAVFAQLVATIRIGLTTPDFLATPKTASSRKEVKQE
jgi:hypothetical protein